jgi:hypothetical protein
MLGRKSIVLPLVRYAVVVALFLFSAGVTRAQVPIAANEKAEARPAASAPVAIATNTEVVASGSATRSTTSDPVRSEAVLMNAAVDGTPKNQPTVSAAVPKSTPAPPPGPCLRKIQAAVVAMPQPIMLNRLGAAIPDGLIFALQGDTVNVGGQFQLRTGKRPRPLVLRANVGDCLTITLTNSIPKDDFKIPPAAVPPSPTPTPGPPYPFNTSEISIHVQGMEWMTGSSDDGSFVGRNNSSLASVNNPPITPLPPNTQSYTLFARQEGTFLLYTMGDTSTTGDQLTRGLFGALNVQPAGAEWYRSQVSADDLLLATYNANRPDQVPPGSLVCTPVGSATCTFTVNGKAVKVNKSPDFGSGPGLTKGGYLHTLDNHPLIHYGALYPATRLDGTPIPAELVNTPVLNMLDTRNNENRIVHSDLTAMITGPKAGRFPGTTGVNKPEPACNAENNPALNPPPGGKVDPLFCANPAAPDRKQPYREVTILYHGALGPIATQAFPILDNAGPNATPAQKNLAAMTQAGQDAFAINYGTGGIGAEIYANRIGVGPMGDCVDCKFEEFFLSAWSVGDPSMLVDRPANVNIQAPLPATPATPPVPPPPPVCTGTQLGDSNPPAAPVPTCAPGRQFKTRTGTVKFSNGSATVTGTGTKFTTELHPGDILVLQSSPSAFRGTVKTITSDTQVVLETNAGASANGAYGATPYTLAPLTKATVAYYPDDPSNVYHSYINDHLKFRILHSGRDVTHVHHQHAHQWLQSPNSDESSYLDSQMISPGASYTLEMVYNGSGNRNKVVGDSIFHCHFYPHFAAGMWAMWRTHDVFEAGTFVYPNGTTVNSVEVSNQVVPGSRALPDGEIIAGTPNPAIVPLPTVPMAPLPAYAQVQNNVTVAGSPAPITVGGQVVVGGTCQANQINGLDVIGGCVNGTVLNGKVINSQYDHALKKMVGQFLPSVANKLENPGFPYFIPGIAGARAPHPPFDFAPDGAGFLDGGLPRHVVTGGSIEFESHSQTDWSKDFATLSALQLPEDGTAVEKSAIAYFSKRCYDTVFPDGSPSLCPPTTVTPPLMTLNAPPKGFVLNGLPLGPQRGAPFADPAVDDNGKPVNVDPVTHIQKVRRYKAAAIQLDVTFNKVGWHFPQQRMLTLWGDVGKTFTYKFGNPASGRKPEPLFFRGNSGDIIEYWHTNLVPNYYVQDDFQVRTPTDILGQHIHLVKFDVTSSDGAGNGFNYEDGTFSPEEVQDIHKALTAPGGSWIPCAGCTSALRPPQPPPADICGVPSPPPQCTTDWLGAQTTVQRWYLDKQVDNSGADRTLRTVFTHDHFGPSTHQQAGLYAGLLVEPTDSTWTSNDGAEPFPNPATRSDGGPTSWQAIITTKNAADSYREFMLEFQDLQLAYQGVELHGGTGIARIENGQFVRGGDQAVNKPPVPSLVTTGLTAAPAGTQSVNYSNDPIALRLGSQSVFPAPSNLSDLSYAYDNATYAALHPGNPPAANDPATPVMRAYENDKVQLRLLVGAHVFAHQFDFEGPTWLAEAAWKNSGYRSVQAMGLSEHFEFLFNAPSSSAAMTGRPCPDGMSQSNCTDYLYSPSFDQTGLANGLWGLFRSYVPTGPATSLKALPNNTVGATANVAYSTCPAALPAPAITRTFNVTAVSAQKALSVRSPISGTTTGQLVLNDRGNPNDRLAVISSSGGAVPLSTGIMYVRSEDLDGNGLLKAGVPIEPLILRANAGDCIVVNLTNNIDPTSDLYKQSFFMAPPFNTTLYPTKASRYVGLHPQLLGYDAAQSYGINVGWNSKGQKDQVVPVGQTIQYKWYAGKVGRSASGVTHTPIEYGSLNLIQSDPLYQNINGLFGSMVIEPAGSTWKCGENSNLGSCDPPPPAAPPVPYPPTSRASATVNLTNSAKFREFVVMISDAMISNNNNPSRPIQASGAVNYTTEPQAFRYQDNITPDLSCMSSNQLNQGPSTTAYGDPKTPIFTADLGNNVRFRMAHPFGTGASQVITVHGHVWQRNPYANNSTQIANNKLSQWLGSRDNHGSSDHFDFVIDKAGGEHGRAGDYLYTGFVPIQARQGAWGIFRVGNVGGIQQLPNAACAPLTRPPNYVKPKVNDDLERFNRPLIKPAP